MNRYWYWPSILGMLFILSLAVWCAAEGRWITAILEVLIASLNVVWLVYARRLFREEQQP